MSVEIMDASVYNEKNSILLNGTSVYEKNWRMQNQWETEIQPSNKKKTYKNKEIKMRNDYDS